MADFFNKSTTMKLDKNKNKNNLNKMGYLSIKIMTLEKILFVIK